MKVQTCHRHTTYWLASCEDCAAARVATLADAVQFRTARPADQCVCPGTCDRHPFSRIVTARLTRWNG